MSVVQSAIRFFSKSQEHLLQFLQQLKLELAKVEQLVHLLPCVEMSKQDVEMSAAPLGADCLDANIPVKLPELNQLISACASLDASSSALLLQVVQKLCETYAKVSQDPQASQLLTGLQSLAIRNQGGSMFTLPTIAPTSSLRADALSLDPIECQAADHDQENLPRSSKAIKRDTTIDRYLEPTLKQQKIATPQIYSGIYITFYIINLY